MIEILHYPDKRLSTIAKTVTDISNPNFQKTIDDMFETLYHTPNCAGLAATQLDIADPYRVTVIDVTDNKSDPLCLINPEIISREGEVTQWEACMSVFPETVHAQVTRAQKIIARALDREGKEIEIEADGILAKCIQHEIDHLNGKLYLNHLSHLKQHMIEKKIAKLKRSP